METVKKFKIKFNGIKICVRPMKDDEIIDEKTIFKTKYYIDCNYQLSKCIGDKVSDHNKLREYFKVLSPYF